jgi:hypothetical protein
LIYRKHSELARQIYYGEKLSQRILCNAQHLRDFERFERNKCDLGRQDRILAAEEDIPHEIKDSLINVWVGIVGNHLVGPYVLLPPDYVQNGAQEICENKHAFTHNYSNFNLLFKPLLFSE